MSRVGKKPIDFSSSVSVEIKDNLVSIKGPKGTLTHELPDSIQVVVVDKQMLVSANENDPKANALRGTTRAVLNNKVLGVTEGFSKKLLLVGVGYRAQVGKVSDGRSKVDLTLGLSHPVTYVAPQGIDLQSAVQTEIVVSGICKVTVGQVAADIRGICKGVRKPEPYKGKGIRYSDEKIRIKETKKKK